MSTLTDFLAGKFLAETDENQVGAIGEAIPMAFSITNDNRDLQGMRDGVVVRYGDGRINLWNAEALGRSHYLFETREAAQAYIDKQNAEEAAE